MKLRNLLIIGFCTLAAFASAQKKSKVSLDYIDKYSKIAVKKMEQHGIPASITLAQGILESGSGTGELVKKSNNHFGIKCHDWKGERVYHDDDIKDDCFRKYDKAEDSFEDHSQFLKRPRYASLYELDIYDYKAWANGLKKCGYATDPNYASRLINLIEVYELYSYDKDAKKSGPTQEEKELAQAEANYQHGTSMGEIHSYTSHEVVKVNGRKAVIARNGDTYESIAKEFGMRKWEIRWCNKVRKGEAPSDGQTVFLRKW